MRKVVAASRLSLLVVICILVSAASAVGNPAEPYRRLAVLEFSGRALDVDVLGAFSDAVRGGAVEGLFQRDVKVMTRENMMVLLREMGRSECTEGDCEVETARNIGADFVISGSVVHIEDAYVVVLKIHETRQGALLASETVQGKTQLAVLSQLRQLGRELAGHTGASPRLPPAGGDVPGKGDQPVSAASPAATETQFAASVKPDTTPSFRRGFLLLPQIGIEYPIVNSAERFGSGYRFGTLVGGHLNEKYSFGADPALGIGNTPEHSEYFGNEVFGYGGNRYYHFDGSLVLLRHVALPWGELLVGPKVGASYVVVKSGGDDSFSLKAGAKGGFFWAPAQSPVALGLVMDLAYMRLSPGGGAKSNTLLTSISAALLL